MTVSTNSPGTTDPALGKILEVEIPAVAAQPERRLYARADLPALLQLTQEQIDRLVKTGQLRAIRIAGEVRYDSHELDALIETYKQIAKRGNNATFNQ